MSRQQLRDGIMSFLFLCGEKRFDGLGKYWRAEILFESMVKHKVIDDFITLDDFRLALGKGTRTGCINVTKWEKNNHYYFNAMLNLHPRDHFGTKDDIDTVICSEAYEACNIPTILKELKSCKNTTM